MLQQLPQELFIHIFSFLFSTTPSELSIFDLLKLIKIIPSLIYVNKEIKNKLLCESFFNCLFNESVLEIYDKQDINVYKYLRKITNNLFEIKNLEVFHVDKIKFLMKQFKNLNNCNLHLDNKNIDENIILLQNIKNLTLNYNFFENYDKLKLIIEKLTNIKTLNLKTKNPFNTAFLDILNLLKLNNLQVKLYYYNNISDFNNEDIIQLNDYKNFIIELYFTNGLNNYKNIISNYNNLKIINFMDIEEEINLKDIHHLESIIAYSCSHLTISNCNKLRTVSLDNLQYLNINEMEHLNYLRIKNVTEFYVNVNEINEFSFYLNTDEYEMDIFTIKINKIIDSCYIDFNIIKEYKELLKSNNLKIKEVTIVDCKNNENLIKELFIGLQKITLDILTDDFNIFLETNNLKKLNNCKELITKEIIDDKNTRLLNNIENCNVLSLDLYNETDIKLINFNSLKELSIYSLNNSVLNLAELNVKKLKIHNSRISNDYIYSGLKELRIANNYIININLNNLPNLKLLNIKNSEIVNLKLEEQRMKLQDISLTNLKQININLTLNCPYLYNFYLSYFQNTENVINIKFNNTPILYFPKIECEI
ncbi:hypothetical protein ABK040_008101 [Willaertia magna]